MKKVYIHPAIKVGIVTIRVNLLQNVSNLKQSVQQRTPTNDDNENQFVKSQDAWDDEW